MESNLFTSWTIYFLVLSSYSMSIEGKPACNISQVVGPRNTVDNAKYTYTGSNANAFLLDHADYRFDCCGFINKWEIYADDTVSYPIDIYLQVWQKMLTVWRLTGNTMVTLMDKGVNHFSIPQNALIRVGTTDMDENIGFYCPYGMMVPYGNGYNYRATTVYSQSTSYDWNGAIMEQNKNFAIHAEVVQSQYPTINLDATVTIKTTTPVGYLIYQIVITDSDPEDQNLVLSLVKATDSALTLFSFRAATHEIILIDFPLTPDTHNMTFSVVDGCGLTSVGTLTIIIEDEVTTTKSNEISFCNHVKPACTVHHQIVGPRNTEDDARDTDTRDTVNAVVLDHSDYQFHCCGFIRAWEIYVDTYSGPSDIYLQVWQKNVVWNLTGENIITPYRDGVYTWFISPGSRIRVGANACDEYIGFYSPNGHIIPYDNGQSYRETYFTSPKTSYNWNSVPLRENRDFAIHAEVEPSLSPTINLDATVTIKTTTPVGFLIYTIMMSDYDREDTDLVLSLVKATDKAFSLFEFRATTHEIFLNAMALTSGTHNMTFSVADACGLKTTGTLTVIIVDDMTANNNGISFCNHGKPACTVAQVVGPGNTQENAKYTDTSDNVNAVVLEHCDYHFACCGFIRAWEIYVDTFSVPSEIFVQVWQKNVVWNLTGENLITTNSGNQIQRFEIAGKRIRVGANDCKEYIGFYSPNGLMLPYNDGYTYRETYFTSPKTSYNWNDEPLKVNRDFAIHAEVEPSQFPTINLDAIATIKTTTPLNFIIHTIMISDSDPEDTDLVLTLVNATDEALTLFHFDVPTRQILYTAHAMTTGTHNMTFSVVDGCGLTAVGTLTIIIEDDVTTTEKNEMSFCSYNRGAYSTRTIRSGFYFSLLLACFNFVLN